MRPTAGGYVGSRGCPNIELVQRAIARAQTAARETTHMDPRHVESMLGIATFNRAVLYLLWYQGFAIAARAIRNPYLPAEKVGPRSGIVTFADKDDGSGHKARLGWIPSNLYLYMKQEEAWFKRVKKTLRATRTDGSPAFFVTSASRGKAVTPSLIEGISVEFFPFPANTQRKVMRFLLSEKNVSSEMIEMYMGHWHDRREPWGRWSSFDVGEYLATLRDVIPEILKDLGFCPVWRKEKGRRR